MIIFLHGTDTYRSRQQLKFYKEGFVKKYDPSGLNCTVLDGEKLTFSDFRKACGATGFLSKKRMIIVENLFSKNKDKKIQHEIIEYIDHEFSKDNVLIFWEEEPDEWRERKKLGVAPFYKRLMKEKQEYFPFLIGEQLNRWIRTEVAKNKGKIDNAAILELASLVGSDLWAMDTEIEKLINYKKNKIIAASDVRQMVRTKFDENIFHLTDALSEKNGKLSLKLLNDQIRSGAHPLYVLTMLVRQFRILLQVKEILNQEENYYTVASRLNLHPFVAQKAIKEARRFTLDELKNIYQKLLEIDIKLKTSQDDPRVLFDLLVMKVCSQ